jgi:hypothetical protein
MFVVFDVDAYFSLGGEVLLYFIEWVEVVKIQIWFEFKLVWDLEKIWKINNPFHFTSRPSAETYSQAQLDAGSLSCTQPVKRPEETPPCAAR